MLNIEALRTEILIELDCCLEKINNNKLVMYPLLERALVKAELFNETVNSNSIKCLLISIRGRLTDVYSSEIKISNTILINDINQLRHFIANVV